MDTAAAELRSLRVALLHDWLFHMRGGEKCLRDLCELFPNSEIFALFADRKAELEEAITRRRIATSFLSSLPFSRTLYRKLLPFFPLGVRHLSYLLDKRHQEEPFDLVISVSHCAVKNVTVPTDLPHICYCLTPARYLWDQFDRYVRSRFLRRISEPLRCNLQRWDRECSRGVSHFIAISRFVSGRISQYYGRSSTVVYPGVDLDPTSPMIGLGKGGEFLVVNALVPYKNTEAIIKAFNDLGLPLRVVGQGPELPRLKMIADSNIEFEERVSEERLRELYRRSVALVFAAEEDFGMTPVEAQSAGRPVICLARGGVRETVLPGRTGVYFNEPTPEAIIEAVRFFLENRETFSVELARKNSEQFSRGRFAENFLKELIEMGIVAQEEQKLFSRHA